MPTTTNRTARPNCPGCHAKMHSYRGDAYCLTCTRYTPADDPHRRLATRHGDPALDEHLVDSRTDRQRSDLAS